MVAFLEFGKMSFEGSDLILIWVKVLCQSGNFFSVIALLFCCFYNKLFVLVEYRISRAIFKRIISSNLNISGLTISWAVYIFDWVLLGWLWSFIETFGWWEDGLVGQSFEASVCSCNNWVLIDSPFHWSWLSGHSRCRSRLRVITII